MNKKKILIYGSKEFGKVMKGLVEYLGYPFQGYIDDIYQGEEIVGTFEYVKKKIPANEYAIVIAVGYRDLSARWVIYREVRKNSYEVPTLIHDKAYVHDKKKIGQGTIIMAGAVIDYNAVVGELVTVWPGVVVNHDCNIGNNIFLSPNATICGGARIGEDSFIGAGSIIIEHNDIPPKSFIKAGQTYFNH